MAFFDKENKSAAAWSVADLSFLYQSRRSELVTHANRLLKDLNRSEEVVQDALIRVILAAPELQSREHALSYLHRTVENLCLDILRIEGRSPRLVLIGDVSAELEARWKVPDHEEIISAADDAALVRQALSMLSSSERAALVMWEIEGRSTKEIARELGIKESSVRHTLSRARGSLRRILTEFVIDEDRGLTALDLLSKTYRKSTDLAKKSSKVALSAILLLFAFLGFYNVGQMNEPTSLVPLANDSSNGLTSTKPQEITQSNIFLKSNGSSVAKNIKSKASNLVENVKATAIWFEGLDKNGVPTGFTITDSQGLRGTLFLSARDALVSDGEWTLTSVAKTQSIGANVLLTQTLSQDLLGVKYDALVSYGRGGRWIPLNSDVISSEIERLVSGNYLVTAVVQVKSEVETAIVIPSTAGGRDLEAAPVRIITRLVLNPSKSQILAQGIQVLEKRAK